MVEIVLEVIGIIVTMHILGGIVLVLCEKIPKAWKTLNSFGRAVFFGVPLLIAVYFMFSFIFYTIIPYFLVNEIARIIFYIVFGIVAYLILTIIGWRNGDLTIKNLGILALIARIIFLLPYMPVLYAGFYIKQIFCKAFISNSNVCWNPHFITHKSKHERIMSSKANKGAMGKDNKNIKYNHDLSKQKIT